jgi:hypothetical protein
VKLVVAPESDEVYVTESDGPDDVEVCKASLSLVELVPVIGELDGE